MGFRLSKIYTRTGDTGETGLGDFTELERGIGGPGIDDLWASMRTLLVVVEAAMMVGGF